MKAIYNPRTCISALALFAAGAFPQLVTAQYFENFQGSEYVAGQTIAGINGWYVGGSSGPDPVYNDQAIIQEIEGVKSVLAFRAPSGQLGVRAGPQLTELTGQLGKTLTGNYKISIDSASATSYVMNAAISTSIGGGGISSRLGANNVSAQFGFTNGNFVYNNAGTNETLISGISTDTLYDVTVVMDFNSRTYDISVVLGEQTYSEEGISFRNTNVSGLDHYLLLNNTADTGITLHEVSIIPEPAHVAVLLGLAGLALAFVVRKRKHS